MLLAIDTSTAAIGAAVHDGTAVRSRVVHEDGRRHAELLAPAIEEALTRAGIGRQDLTRVVCGVGPGPFTGLRVGIVTALVLARALDLPRPDGVCSLDALAHAMVGRHEGPLLVATDARRKEVYWARYEVTGTGTARIEGPGVSRAADLSPELREIPAVGRGTLLYPEDLTGAVPGPVDVDPADLATLVVGGGARLLEPEPLYLRRPDAVETAAR